MERLEVGKVEWLVFNLTIFNENKKIKINKNIKKISA